MVVFYVMNILVIGNGFDIAHELDTSYKKFADFCECISVFFKSWDTSKNLYLNEEDRNELTKVMKEKGIKDEIISNLITFMNSNENSNENKICLIEKCKSNYWLKYIFANRDVIGDRWCDLEYVMQKQVEALAFCEKNPEFNRNDIKYFETKMIFNM